MCLFTKQKEPLIAQEDIKCFKILREESGQWITPYRDYPIKFNIELTSEDNEKDTLLKVFGFYQVDKGYFHSCNSKESAIKYMQDIKITYTRRKYKCPPLTAFKAIIPKGSKYYIGAGEDLCSNKLIIINE